MKKRNIIMHWRGLTPLGKGLFMALGGILIKSAGSLANNDILALSLTTVGIIIFVIGLFKVMLEMDSGFKDYELLHLVNREKK